MSRYSRTILIASPPADVWATLRDVETWPEWATQFERLELLDSGPLRLESRVRVKPHGLPAGIWSVTEYEAGSSFTWTSTLMPGVNLAGGHALRPDGEATSAEFWLEAGGALGTLLSPLLRRTTFSRNTRSATEGLKRRMEHSPTAK